MTRRLPLLCAAACAFVWIASVPAYPSTLPPGFTETLVAGGLSNPTAMAIAPDGRVFVCQQGGQLRVVKDGALLAAPFVTLTVNSSGERGLLGVAFDPAFETNGFVYVYYTATSPGIHNRVSRFTAAGDVATPGSEFVLMNLEPLGATNHNGGAIHFGLDGKLYVAVGENAVGTNSQTLTNRLGKLLRINSDGTIPDDNPFVDEATDANRSIWALGLRNPFTFSVHPFSGRVFINDVGQSAWEEINDGQAGANYGWPTTEGPTTDPRFDAPFFAYDRRGTGECAITGGAFYSPATAQFPGEYVGQYFFTDLCGGWIRRLNPSDRSVSGFATGLVSPVDLKVSDDGSLYYLARGTGASTGVLYRIDHQAVAAANLAVSALKAPPGAGSGGAITVTDTTRNEGAGNAAPSRTAIWLSTNKTLGGDTLLGTRAVPALQPGQNSKGTVAVTLPAVSAGTYFLIAEADTQQGVPETHEGDNVRARKLTIGPDLSARMTLSPSPPTSATPTNFVVTTTNGGYDTAAASTTRLYRSADGSVDAGDAAIATVSVPSLTPGQSHTQELALTLPAGTYFLIVKADATSVVAEASESNNTQKAKKSS
jgi:glucose/arabinose dehydrogenase